MRPPLFLAELGAKAVTALDAESAHNLTIKMLKAGKGPKVRVRNTRLSIDVAGLHFRNPLGMAAGFDKNAEAPDAILDLGFGFAEAGAVTPLPQPGNPAPRVFRLRPDAAVINRYGFNNDGLEKISARLRGRERRGIVGINLGANKNSENRTADYVKGIEGLAGAVDFFTVNISSPNTPGLRTLQDKTALKNLMDRVLTARDTVAAQTPVFLKIAPDLTDEDKQDIASVVREVSLDGLIVSNTTITRPDTLRSEFAAETGGLSGKPLFGPSTRVLREFYQSLGPGFPLIGVGGVSSARDAYEKILNGASLVQLYTAMIYEGPGLPARIIRDLPAFLEADGLDTIAEAVGAAVA